MASGRRLGEGDQARKVAGARSGPHHKVKDREDDPLPLPRHFPPLIPRDSNLLPPPESSKSNCKQTRGDGADCSRTLTVCDLAEEGGGGVLAEDAEGGNEVDLRGGEAEGAGEDGGVEGEGEDA